MYTTNQKPPEPPYEYQEYPKWIEGTIVNSAKEEAALAKPAKSKKPAPSTDA